MAPTAATAPVKKEEAQKPAAAAPVSNGVTGGRTAEPMQTDEKKEEESGPCGLPKKCTIL